MANVKKPYKGVITHWALINGRIFGSLLDPQDPLGRRADITTSAVVTILGYEHPTVVETRNSIYILA